MKKILILLIYLVLGSCSLSFSQNDEEHKYYIIQLRTFDQTFNTTIPFVKFSVLLKDSVLYLSNSDFDGFANLFFDCSLTNTASLYLKISYHSNEHEDTYGDLIRIPFSNIKLLEPIDIDKKISISLTKFAELDEYEYNKRKSELIPDRKETKAVDVK